MEAKKQTKTKAKAKTVVAPEESGRGERKTRVGIAVSTGMNKTIVVAVKSSKKHFYGKIVKTEKKFKVHDENNEAGIGDTVEIMETRKLSKTKYFRLVRIVEKAK